MPWDIYGTLASALQSRKNERRVVSETTHKQGCIQWEAFGLVWRGFCTVFAERRRARATAAPLWGVLSGRRF
jgi:hypothetical protein